MRTTAYGWFAPLSWVLCSLLPGCGQDDGAEPSLDPAGVPASEELSDELDDPGALGRWRLWVEVDGETFRLIKVQ